jgi:DNA-binding PadR family transcriptional regulator
MFISHTLLGMLARKSLTGYAMRKIMLESPFLYWSGNTNQIYKALAKLTDEACVTSESVYQDGAPAKKIYTLTDDGQNELRREGKALDGAGKSAQTPVLSGVRHARRGALGFN